MHVQRLTSGVLAPLLLAAEIGTWRLAPAETTDPVDRFTGFAINMSDMSRAATAMVEISIERWSTNADRDKLMAALDEGPDEMMDVLEDLPRAGVLRSPFGIPITLQYARRTVNADKSERIELLTERPIDFDYSFRRPGVSDYPFTLIELRLGPNGEGQGKMSYATKIVRADGKTGAILIENYDDQPIALTQIKRVARGF
jgi:hypothetical protein